jgi:hypothetical protein
MPLLNIELTMKPKNIHVGPGGYLVSVYLDEQLAFVLPTRYNSYDDAAEATRQYIYERLMND